MAYSNINQINLSTPSSLGSLDGFDINQVPNYPNKYVPEGQGHCFDNVKKITLLDVSNTEVDEYFHNNMNYFLEKYHQNLSARNIDNAKDECIQILLRFKMSKVSDEYTNACCQAYPPMGQTKYDNLLKNIKKCSEKCLEKIISLRNEISISLPVVEPSIRFSQLQSACYKSKLSLHLSELNNAINKYKNFCLTKGLDIANPTAFQAQESFVYVLDRLLKNCIFKNVSGINLSVLDFLSFNERQIEMSMFGAQQEIENKDFEHPNSVIGDTLSSLKLLLQRGSAELLKGSGYTHLNQPDKEKKEEPQCSRAELFKRSGKLDEDEDEVTKKEIQWLVSLQYIAEHSALQIETIYKLSINKIADKHTEFVRERVPLAHKKYVPTSPEYNKEIKDNIERQKKLFYAKKESVEQQKVLARTQMGTWQDLLNFYVPENVKCKKQYAKDVANESRKHHEGDLKLLASKLQANNSLYYHPHTVKQLLMRPMKSTNNTLTVKDVLLGRGLAARTSDRGVEQTLFKPVYQELRGLKGQFKAALQAMNIDIDSQVIESRT